MPSYIKPVIFFLVIISFWSCNTTRLADCPDLSKNKALKKHQKYLQRIKSTEQLVVKTEMSDHTEISSTTVKNTEGYEELTNRSKINSEVLPHDLTLTASTKSNQTSTELEEQEVDEVESLLSSLSPKQQNKLNKLQKRIEKTSSKLEAKGKTDSDVNGMAIASFVTGIVGLFIFGYILGALAIIFGAISLAKIKKTGQGGRGLAIAGLILGIVGIVALTIILV